MAINMCTHGTLKQITIEQTISVDSCIADEIIWLNKNGVHTIGCCCGHGKEYPHKGKAKPTAIIESSKARLAEKLGYKIHQQHQKPWMWYIELKGDNFEEEPIVNCRGGLPPDSVTWNFEEEK